MPFSLHRRALPFVLAAPLVGALPAADASAQPARAALAQSPRIVGLQKHIVFGKVRFAADVASGARKVVFLIDGRPVWATTHAPFRFRGTGVLNTARLKAGRHTFAVEVVYRSRQVRIAERTVVVRHHGTTTTTAIASAARKRPGRTPTPVVTTPLPDPHPPTTPTPVPTPTPTPTPTPVPTTVTGVPGAASSSVLNFSRTTYGFSTQLTMAQEANRYQVLDLQSTDADKIPALKAANPNLKVVMYQTPIHTIGSNGPVIPTATSCSSTIDDTTNHPDWIVKDATGAQIHSTWDPTGLMMDIANPAYLAKCAANAIAQAKRLGFDGVFWDEIDGYVSEELAAGQTAPEWPTNASWVNSVGSMLGYLSGQLHANGLISIANIGGAPDVATWEGWVSPLDGVEEESFTDGNAGLAQQVPWFADKLTELAWAQTHGKYYLAHSWNSTEAGNTYGLASMLLAANGTASYETSNNDYNWQENWYPEYTTAQGLGAPTGAYTRLGNGVLERHFQHGIVLVNPTNAAVPSFSLGGTYTGSGLTGATSASLAPTSGLVLLGG